MDYFIHILILLGIYFILTSSTQILVGMTNLISLGQAAFYGIGAYITAFSLMTLNLSLIPTLILVLGFNSLLAFLLAIPTIKLKGDYFILATLGFQLIIFSILNNWTGVTKGPFGIRGIPSVNLLNVIEINGIYSFLFLAVFLSIIVFYIFFRLLHSPFGRVLIAVREDDILLTSLGKNPIKFKVLAFVISGGLTGWAGFIFASYIKFIDPTSFDLNEALFILAAVLIGGLGNIKGSFAGALFVVIVPELLRVVGLPDSIAAPMRQILYGIILMLLMYFRPQGIAGEYILK